jgi:hypothetical protein
MAVIACVECGAEVNEAVARCPECGADPRTGVSVEERAEAERRRPLDPVELARLARERGQRFLEVALPFAGDEVVAMRTGRRQLSAEGNAVSRAVQLSAIEDEGWELVGSGYLAGGLGYERDALALIDGGAIDPVSVTGIYLFRAVEAVDEV